MKILEDDLPLFPLYTVLFPQARLPLHIFEPRYREMIDRCEREDLAFGVLLIKAGVAVGGSATPHAIGTLARIIEVARLPDDRMNIVTAGVARFRLLAQFDARAYLTGKIELLPDEPVDPVDPVDPGQVESVVFDVRRKFVEYVRAVQSVGDPAGAARALNVPADPTMLSYLVAAVLPINSLDKQVLLEAQSTRERLRRELAFLQREAELPGAITDARKHARDQGAFSLN